MNEEEQAILDFFARAENLQLGLAVAEQVDAQRVLMNNRFWRDLQRRLEVLISENGLVWKVELTTDGNAPDTLVGLFCSTGSEQQVYLRPMLEQQYLGGTWRIYHGLMWSNKPGADQLGLPGVISLKSLLQQAGFKSNENFLAWQWTAFHPRRKDFLLGYAQNPERMLGAIETVFSSLLIEHLIGLDQANAELGSVPQGLAASLKQMRDELID